MNKSNTLFEQIADESFLGLVAFCSKNKTCLYINKVAREYLEFSNDNIQELALSHLIPENTNTDRFRPFSVDFLNFEGLTQDVLVKKATGRTFLADVGVRSLTSNNTQYIIIMLRDITIQKKLQRDLTAKQQEIQKAFQEILEQNQALKELDKAKDKFIALTTHELRTPLSAMIATAEVLHMKLYDTQDQLEQFIETIYKEGLHMLEIVNDILDFAKIQAGKMDFYIEQKNIKELVEKECKTFKNMAAEKEVTIHLEAKNETYLAYFDPLRFRQSIDNVINNAIKFTKPKTTIHVRISEDSDYIRISVRDEGEGIPTHLQSKVFDEFETVGNVKSHHKGTGLGMPITRKLMETMGGKIDLISEPGQGAEFVLSLPKNKILAEDLYRERPQHSDDLAA